MPESGGGCSAAPWSRSTPPRARAAASKHFLPAILFTVCFAVYVGNGDFLPGNDQVGNMLFSVNLRRPRGDTRASEPCSVAPLQLGTVLRDENAFFMCKPSTLFIGSAAVEPQCTGIATAAGRRRRW